MKPENSRRLAFADSIRGLAALWVVLYHLYEGGHVNQLSHVIGPWLTIVFFEYGNLGVPVFFVISGFVMAVTTNTKLMNGEHSVRFMVRRIIRISPPYYFAIALSLLLMWLKVRFFEPALTLPTMHEVVAHLFYLQGLLGFPQINSVFWTLCYEMQFYLLFSIIMYLVFRFNSSPYASTLLIVMATIPGLLWLVLGDVQSAWVRQAEFRMIFITYWYAFCAGALVGWSVIRPGGFHGYVLAFSVFILLLGLFKQQGFAITAGATACTLYLALQRKKMDSWLHWQALQTLGLISYSLYLTHNNVTGVVQRLLRYFFSVGLVPEIIFATVSVLSSLVFAWLIYRFIEQPVIRLSQKIRY